MSARFHSQHLLRTELDAGPVVVGKRRDAAINAGLSWRTVERARAQLGVRSRMRGLSDGWVWFFEDHPKRPGLRLSPDLTKKERRRLSIGSPA